MPKIITDPQTVNSVLDSFARTTDQIVSLDELRTRLLSGKQLVMKYGVDVTSPDLHIGHAVNLWMYRRLQELGHKVIFLIGDFTTQIGDPSGKSKARPIIPIEEVQRNAQAFIDQAMMVLHNDPETAEVRRNSEWLEPMGAKQLLSLMSAVTHEKLVSRDMFRKRIQEGREIYEHELVYPLLQGYDSVALHADLAIIGSDQLFNEMLGRDLQARHGQPTQVVLTTKITPGIDGKEKQSKSLGNYIGLNHSPREKFGRIMSMPDELIESYFSVYTELAPSAISGLQTEFNGDPMNLKLRLAREIVARYHGNEVGEHELDWFRRTFMERAAPEDAPVVLVEGENPTILTILIKCFGMDKSKSELHRLIKQRGVTVNGQHAESPNEVIELPAIVKVGKRHWFRVEA